MPIFEKTDGYDAIISYSEEEIARMYIEEGVNPSKAYIDAKKIRREIKRLNTQEQRFWKRVRRNEDAIGGLIENF